MLTDVEVEIGIDFGKQEVKSVCEVGSAKHSQDES